MTLRSWIALALASGSWLFGLGLYHPANWIVWAVLTGGAVALWAARPPWRPRLDQVGLALVLLVPALWWAPWPYRLIAVLLAGGLVLLVVPVPRRWPEALGWGALCAAAVMVIQALGIELYVARTARSHDLPLPLAWLVAGVGRLLGLDVAVGPQGLAIHAVRQVHRLPATWELLLGPVTVAWFAGGLVWLGWVAVESFPQGQRWGGWMGLVRRFALIVAAWLPVRIALLLGLYLDRTMRVGPSEVPTTMNQFFSHWVQLALLAAPVLAAWWLVRLPRGWRHASEGDTAAQPESVHAAPALRASLGPTLLLAAGVAILGFVLCWEPVGGRKGGRVMVVERHSTWEPTDRPYDTEHFGHDPSYSYSLIYNYAAHYYRMSRLVESERITPQRLEGCDVLVIKIPTARYAPDEVDAVVDFVRRGGGLLLIGDHTNVFNSSTYLNDICRPLGFTFRHDLLFCIGSPYQQLVRPGAVPHPAVQHVPVMHYAVSCSIDPGRSLGRAVVRGGGLWSLPPFYHAENYHPQAEYRPEMRYGAFIQLWAARPGRGRVLAFTDSTIFSNFCIFQPGKAELMMGMLEWLNRTSRFDAAPLRWLVRGAGVLAGLVVLGIGLVAGRRQLAWPVALAAALGGGAVGTALVTMAHRAAMPPAPERPDRPMRRVVIDRTVSEVPLSLGAYTQGDGEGYGLLEQWIPRLGYFTMRRSGADAFTGDALVVIAPTRSVSRQYRESLVRYVQQGGHLLVLDSPAVVGSTANSLLWPFGLASSHADGKAGPLAFANGWPAMKITGSSAIRGGEPFLRVDDVPVGARVRYGRGQVTAVGVGSLFNDMVMGGAWTVEPNEQQRTIYQLLFAIVRGAVEGRPIVPPERPRASSPQETTAAGEPR